MTKLGTTEKQVEAIEANLAYAVELANFAKNGYIVKLLDEKTSFICSF